MKLGTRLDPNQTMPDRLQEEIHKRFPDRQLSDLSIRYYENVADVGYEYFKGSVLPISHNHASVRCLEPFIAFISLGEAIILAQEGAVIYDSDRNNGCTETGPFWFVTTKEKQESLPC